MFDYEKFSTLTRTDPFSGEALGQRVSELREKLSEESPHELAARAGVDIVKTADGGSLLKLNFFGDAVSIDVRTFRALAKDHSELPLIVQAVLLYFFTTANGNPIHGQWVSFSELPDGRIYNQAFQKYSGDRLARECESDVDKFRNFCLKAGGIPVHMADAAFLFPVLPRFPLLLAFWQGDDDFASSCKVLFDSGSRNYLPIDGCAIIGSMLVSTVIRKGKGA